MSKIDEIRSAMVAAMKAGDKERKAALSFLLSSLKNKAIDKRADLTEEEEGQVILKEIKQLKETIDMTPEDRTDLIEEAQKRLAVLEEYAPKMMSEDEIKAVITSVLADLGIDAPTAKDKGKIMTERYGGFDNIPGVFAGGDCASGPASVIKAIAAAKVVAANIDEYLGFHHIISCDVEIPEPRLSDREPCGRVELTEREACSRVCDFEGVENCMTEAEAKQESHRCLRCDHFGYGIFKGGRKEKW